MITITIKMDTDVPLDYGKYGEVMFNLSKMFHEALANGLKTSKRADYSWTAVGKDVIVSFRPAENWRKYSNVPSSIIIRENMYIVIITDDFKVASKYVEKVIDIILNSPHLIYNVEITGGDCGQQ
jgi:hypothetical protein